MIKNSLLKFIKKGIILHKIKHGSVAVRNKVLKTYCELLRIEKKTILFEAYLAQSYACSPRAIYEYLLTTEKYNDYRFIWAFKDPKRYGFLAKNERTVIVKYRSFQYYKALAKSKFWIVNGWIPTLITKKPSQVMVQTWHGTPLKRLRNDLIPNTKHATLSFKKQVEANKVDAARYDYFISPSRFASQVFRSAFALDTLGKEDILIETGYPRNDFLFRFTESDVKKIKTKLSIPKGKKILLYAPTWRDDQYAKGQGFTYQLEINFDDLKREIGDEYIVLFRAHYNVAKQFDFVRHKGFVYDVSGVDDVNDLYIISDVLVTDYSSVFFDYANLKRPMIFFMYDLEYYEQQLRGFYFDVKELPGPVVKTNKQLTSAIGDLPKLSKKYAKAYNAFNGKYNYLDDAHASQRVVEKVIG